MINVLYIIVVDIDCKKTTSPQQSMYKEMGSLGQCFSYFSVVPVMSYFSYTDPGWSSNSRIWMRALAEIAKVFPV